MNHEPRVLKYRPRPPFVPMHQRSQRFGSLVCHRRAGKSYSAIHEAVIRALYTPKQDARYAYIAPFRAQAKEIGWVYLKAAARPFIKSEKDIRESELRVRLFNDNWITLYGSDNPDALRGIYLDGAILDEFGDCRPNLWHEVILPTLTDRQGWALIAGTPRGKNAFFRLNEIAKKDPEWFQLTLKASESGLLPEKELRMMQAQMSEDQYAQEMECSFEAAVLGTYYAQIISRMEDQGRMAKRNLFDPEQRVNVVMDLGFTDSTAIWFWQHRPDGIAVIDYHEAHSQPLSYYFDLLKSLALVGYQYENIFLPHDAKAKTLQTGRSTIEQFMEFFSDQDANIRLVPNLKIQQGIDAARLVLPHCWFDADNCGDGWETLRAYRRKYNEVTKQYSNAPLHDWASNGADAFRYFALVTRLSLNIPSNDEPEDLIWRPPSFTLDDLFAAKESRDQKHGYQKMRI
jgi:phage terminase large subunit